MDPITILFFAAGVAVFIYMYRGSRTSAPVPLEHQVPVPEGGLEAIEYFWRPG